MSRTKRKPAKRKGGSAMLDAGYKASQLWYTPHDYELVRTAAIIARMPMTKFAIGATVAAARATIARKHGFVNLAGGKGVDRG